MDSKSEDKIVQQIERSLSNNIDENIFFSGRIYDDHISQKRSNRVPALAIEGDDDQTDTQEYPLVSNDYISDYQPSISRAEYIRLAREACLKQLSNSQVYTKPYDANYMDNETPTDEELTEKKAKAWKLFSEDAAAKESKHEDSPQEIASFHALIIRTICAVILFLTIFAIDKFEVNIGGLNHSMIQQYVTGNDSLQEFEDIIVTWLK